MTAFKGPGVQSVSTPWSLIRACEALIGGEFSSDLASSEEMAKAPHFLTEEENSLQTDWQQYLEAGWCWLNPPFRRVEPWLLKIRKEMRSYKGHHGIVVLVPGSIGASWMHQHLLGHADVFCLRGRVQFDGHQYRFPRDLIVAVYKNRFGAKPNLRVQLWDWERTAKEQAFDSAHLLRPAEYTE